MDYQKLLDGHFRFGSSKEEACYAGLGVRPDQVRKNVVIAPMWEPASLPAFTQVTYLSPSETVPVKVWDLSFGAGHATYIKTGIGAPNIMDAVLALGLTPCERLIFIGAVGSLSREIDIGDIIIPEFSVCGDGASRYIISDDLASGDVFGQAAYPDEQLLEKTKSVCQSLCRERGAKWRPVKNYSIDTIFAQFAHIDEILGLGCETVEMETASAFLAAKIASIKATAVFLVSDNTITHKSLVSGRTEDELLSYKKARRELLPDIIAGIFDK